MVIAAATHEDMMITRDDLLVANNMLSDLELDMPQVFARIGRTENALYAERFLSHLRRVGAISYADAHKFIYSHFPDARDMEGIMTGIIRAGFVELVNQGGTPWLFWKGKDIAGSISPNPPGTKH
jgi:hypothetical protein